LPDGLGIFKPKPHFWYILEGLWMQILIYFMIIWCYTLWPFTLLRGNLVYYAVFYYIIRILVSCIKKNPATLRRRWLANFSPSHLFVTATAFDRIGDRLTTACCCVYMCKRILTLKIFFIRLFHSKTRINNAN
jgi:hypothetical protein